MPKYQGWAAVGQWVKWHRADPGTGLTQVVDAQVIVYFGTTCQVRATVDGRPIEKVVSMKDLKPGKGRTN